MPSLFYFKPKAGFPEWETQEAFEWLLKNEGKKCWAEMEKETGVVTGPQFRGLHVGFKQVADTLNNAGLDMRKVIKPEIEIPWTKESVKEYLYRPILKTMTSKKSTKEMDKIEPGEVWEVMMRFLGQNHGVEYIEFPNRKKKNETVIS